MSSLQKIDEWIKEAEDRPQSALMILRLIAGRLRELTDRNEELLAENIALQDGTRVEEYTRRIAHLERQLELLKRRFGPDGVLAADALELSTVPQMISLVLYQARGKLVRIEPGLPDLSSKTSLGQITGDVFPWGEFPRLLAVPSPEELLMVFTSGRVSSCAVAQVPALENEGIWSWDQASLPDEPHGGELLAALVPFTSLPLADFFIQVSRRGCVKKTMTSLAENIMTNHYLGRGTLQKADRPFETILCRKNARLVLVTYEGRLLSLDVDDLTFSTEERIRLQPHDHVIAAFLIEPDQSLICLTQTGKVIHRESVVMEPAKSGSARGQALIPTSRLEQGTRFVGAAAIREPERVLVLNTAGGLTLHACTEITGLGALPIEEPVLAFCVVPAVRPESGS
jgi:hypothetical protein